MSNLDPQTVFEALLERMKTKRSRSSLEAIHEVCRDHKETGSLDFRVATIVRFGADRGVPSAQTIKNATGEAYRALIKAWQESVPKPKKTRASDDWVSEVKDARIRFLIEDLIVRNKRLEQQIKVFRQADFNIDLRETVQSNDLPEFIDSEIEALKNAISESFLHKMGWEADSRGRVTSSKGNKIYGPGYVTAIEKLLSILPK